MENSKVIAYLESLETKVKKLVAEHQSLKTELMASMEENKNLTIQTQYLEDEIHNLNQKQEEKGFEHQDFEEKMLFLQEENKELHETVQRLQNELKTFVDRGVHSGAEKGGLEIIILQLQEENKGLSDSLTLIEEHIKEIQFKSEALLSEFDRVQNLNIDLTERNIELERSSKQNVNFNESELGTSNEAFLTNEKVQLILAQNSKELQEWKEKAEKQEEALKNFINQEKNSKIVESIAEDGTQSNELKLRINEYIKEIDKCIAQLSD